MFGHGPTSLPSAESWPRRLTLPRWRTASPQPLAQRGVGPLEGSVCASPPEPSVDGLPGRKDLGQQPPGAAALEHVEDGVGDLASAMDSRSSSLVGAWDVELQTLPFAIG